MVIAEARWASQVSHRTWPRSDPGTHSVAGVLLVGSPCLGGGRLCDWWQRILAAIEEHVRTLAAELLGDK